MTDLVTGLMLWSMPPPFVIGLFREVPGLGASCVAFESNSSSATPCRKQQQVQLSGAMVAYQKTHASM
jgi:hypothetical protein